MSDGWTPGALARVTVGVLTLMGGAFIVPAWADTRLFTGEKWTVDGAVDSAPNPRNIAITVNGQPAGAFSELKVFYDLPTGAPQVFSVKGSGALRPVLHPPGEFGATFYATGYWDCMRSFVQNTAITALSISIDPQSPGVLRLSGNASNLASFAATDFTLRFSPPSAASVKVEVSYTLAATAALCVDQVRQGRHEGFRIARIASNFLATGSDDSDQARPLNFVAAESIRMLDVGVPPVQPGAYQWLTGFLSEDLSILGGVAVTPFAIE